MKTLDALLLTDLNPCAVSYCITISKVFNFFEMEFLSLWNFVYLKTILRSENECEPFSTALLLGDLTYVWERPGTEKVRRENGNQGSLYVLFEQRKYLYCWRWEGIYDFQSKQQCWKLHAKKSLCHFQIVHIYFKRTHAGSLLWNLWMKWTIWPLIWPLKMIAERKRSFLYRDIPVIMRYSIFSWE